MPPVESDGIFALLDLGATNGQPEDDATGGQIGGGTSGTNGRPLAATSLEAGTGGEFTLAIDNVDPSGTAVGNIDWRDRGDADDGALMKLAEDFLKNNAGMIRVTLGGLPQGTYEITSFHIDPAFSQCEAINVLVTDADGVAVDTGLTGTAFFEGDPPGLENLTEAQITERSVTFSVKSDGSSDVIIYFDGTSATDREVPLSGMKILASDAGGSQTILSFIGVPSSVQFGQSSTLRWVVDEAATAISIAPDIGDVLAMTTDGSGSIEVTPAVDTTYTLSVTTPGASTEAATVVSVDLASEFTSESTFLEVGGTATLTWNVRPDAIITIEPDVGDVSALTQPDGTGQVDVSPEVTTVYTLTATVGETQQDLEFEVRVAPEPRGELFALLDIGPFDGDPEDGATTEEVIGGGGTGENGLPLDPVTIESETGVEFGISMDAVSVDGEFIGGLDWRNRGFAIGDPLTRLGMDFVKNNLGVIAVTLTDIPAGDYNVISYHVDPGFSQCEAIRIFVTDALGEARDTGVIADSSFVGDPPGEALTTGDVKQRSFGFSFTSDGSDVVIYFDGSAALDDEVPLSGLMILRDTGIAEEFEITRISRDSSTGHVTLEWPAAVGVAYAIESSTDLQDWLEVADSFEPDSADAVFVDETVDGEDGERYYRIYIP